VKGMAKIRVVPSRVWNTRDLNHHKKSQIRHEHVYHPQIKDLTTREREREREHKRR
jgi:hypothetical protein